MMKKIIALALAAVMLVPLLSGCSASLKKREAVGKLNIPNPNYNSIQSLGYGIDSAIGDTVIYTKDGFYNAITTLVADGKKYKLLTGTDPRLVSKGQIYSGDLVVLGDKGYFTAYSEIEKNTPEEMGTFPHESYFYEYDLENDEFKEIYKSDYVYEWAVSDDFLVYTISNYGMDDDYVCSLYVYSFGTDEALLVCDDAEAFSVVNGNVRYITYEECFSLCEYDPESAEEVCLGVFEIDPEAVEYDYAWYNFTEDRVIINSINIDSRSFYIYSTVEGTIDEYTVPCNIVDLRAGEDYAYIHCEKSYYDEPNEDDGIYRLDFSDMTVEKLDIELEQYVYMFVGPDDSLYLEMYGDAVFTNSVYSVYDENEGKLRDLFKSW